MAESAGGSERPDGSDAPTAVSRHPATLPEASAEEYRLMIEKAPVGILVVQDGRFVYLNDGAHALATRSMAELTAREFLAVIHPDDRKLLAERSAAVLAGEAPLGPLEFRSISANGEARWLRSTATLIQWRGRPAIMSFLEDISAAKVVEENLKKSEARYEELVARAPVAIAETDVSHNRFVRVNDVACELLGLSREELLAMKVDDILPMDMVPRRAARVSRMLVGEWVAETSEFRVRKKGGGEIWAVANVSVTRAADGSIRAVVIAHDITANKKAEEELQRIERLQSLGVLAGGIAHDFNNILTAVLGNVSLARLATGNGERDRLLGETEKACLRARELTQQLLTFSKGGAPIRRATAIGRALREWVTFALRGSQVQCVFDIPDDLWPAEVDEGQMSQVLHNLVINAAQAMPDGGVVEVRAQNHELAGGDRDAVTPGRYIVLSVKDRGVGIPPENLSRIFDPFFTTKTTGSGLGLATVFSIVKRHDGQIQVVSEVGKGSTFSVYLPAAKGPVVGVEPAASRLAAGSGAVLLMDDDETVRLVGEQMLKRLGYEVVTAVDGNEAIALYKERHAKGTPFVAVIMDLTVPGGVGGLEAIKGLKSLDRDVRAIVSSGYSTAPAMADAAAYGFSGVVAKPFTIDDLVRELKRVGVG